MFGTSKDGTLFARVGISQNPNVSFKICFIFLALVKFYPCWFGFKAEVQFEWCFVNY